MFAFEHPLKRKKREKLDILKELFYWVFEQVILLKDIIVNYKVLVYKKAVFFNIILILLYFSMIY